MDSRFAKKIDSLSDQHAISRRTKKYTVDDIDKLLAKPRPDDNNQGDQLGDFDADGDAAMEIDDDHTTQELSSYLAEQRKAGSLASLDASQDAMDTDPVIEKRDFVTIFVLDTNFIISHLNTLERLRALSSEFNHQIVVPRTVIQELDGLKNSEKIVLPSKNGEWSSQGGQSIGLLARKANDWLYRNLADLDSGVVGQRLAQRLDFQSSKDDSILDCCMYFKARLNRFVVLLSNDKNLCLKALTDEIPTISYRKGMTAELIAGRTMYENRGLAGNNLQPKEINELPRQDISTITSGQTYSTFHNEISSIVLGAVETVMVHEYGDDLELLDYDRNKLHTLKDASRCIAKFWLSTFSQYFHRNQLDVKTWKSLPEGLTRIPTNPREQADFVQFWTFVLESLYVSHDQRQKDALQTLVKRWRSSVNEPSQT